MQHVHHAEKIKERIEKNVVVVVLILHDFGNLEFDLRPDK
jgi:hypothetical protein